MSSPLPSVTEPLELLDERRNLVRVRENVLSERDRWIRHQVLVNGRIDVLAREVLDLEIAPHHFAIMQHQSKYRDRRGCLVLTGRGLGKTMIGTQVRMVFEILRNPNIRIIVASRAADNATTIANWARVVFESNEKLRRIFGDFVGRSLWDKRRWTVAKRTEILPDPTVQVLGEDSATASRHCDILFCDDLVDNRNSWTLLRRKRTLEFYYKILLPCVLAQGMIFVSGTRYHADDLYGHWLDPKKGGEMSGDRALVMPSLIPIVDTPDDAPEHEKWTSLWEKMHPVVELVRLMKSMGRVLFYSQYMMDTTLMKGSIFDWDWFHWLDPDDADDAKQLEVASRLPHYQGTDLAIGEGDRNDFFADVIISVDRHKKHVYVRDVFTDRIPFIKQKETVLSRHRRFAVLRGLMESNAYQKALWGEVVRENPGVKIVPKHTSLDKVARGQALTPVFTDWKVFVVTGKHEKFVDTMVLFPDVEFDDEFDGFEFAWQASKIREMKPREEFGII